MAPRSSAPRLGLPAEEEEEAALSLLLLQPAAAVEAVAVADPPPSSSDDDSSSIVSVAGISGGISYPGALFPNKGECGHLSSAGGRACQSVGIPIYSYTAVARQRPQQAAVTRSAQQLQCGCAQPPKQCRRQSAVSHMPKI